MALSGELAERQGIAVLTRRDRKVAQVRSLHSPPTLRPAQQASAGAPAAARVKLMQQPADLPYELAQRPAPT